MALVPPLHHPSSNTAGTELWTAGWGWGADDHGQLGAGLGNGVVSSPHALDLPAGATAVATGRDFTLVLVGHSLYAFGRNDRGQLGDGTRISRATAVRIPLPPVVSVAADERHALAVTTDGQVYAWGANVDGQLGDGTTTDRDTPVHIPVGGAKVAQIGTGTGFSLAVTTAGRLWAWGSNANGQLGNGTTRNALRPVAVPMPEGEQVRAVAAGSRHAVAVTDRGALLAWGADDRGQLGVADRTSVTPVTAPTAVRLPGRVAQVVAGLAHTEVLLADGSVWAWGANDLGQLGDTTRSDRTRPTRVRLPSGTTVGQLSVAQNATVAVTHDGAGLLTWGVSPFGLRQSGSSPGSLQTIQIPAVPQAIRLPGTPHIRQAVVGYDFTVVLVDATRPVRLEAAWTDHPVRTGQSITLGATAFDRSGDRIAVDVTAAVAGGSCHGSTCTIDTPGLHTVTLSAAGLQTTVTIRVRGAAATVGGTTASSPGATQTVAPQPTRLAAPVAARSTRTTHAVWPWWLGAGVLLVLVAVLLLMMITRHRRKARKALVP